MTDGTDSRYQSMQGLLTFYAFIVNVSIDNIAVPLASSFGDLVTLVILSGIAVFLADYIRELHEPCLRINEGSTPMHAVRFDYLTNLFCSHILPTS